MWPVLFRRHTSCLWMRPQCSFSRSECCIHHRIKDEDRAARDDGGGGQLTWRGHLVLVSVQGGKRDSVCKHKLTRCKQTAEGSLLWLLEQKTVACWKSGEKKWTWVNIWIHIYTDTCQHSDSTRIYMRVCMCICLCVYTHIWLPGWLSGKASACNARDAGSIPGSGRSPGEGNGNPLQYSCWWFQNPMDRGA